MINFLMGGIFLYMCLPILESLTSVICSVLEIFKAQCNLKITECNNKMSNINNPPKDKHSIGFQDEET